MGFVDIHSHILYGLDDGAKTREESVAMLEIARRSGTTDIVATPHANGQYAFQPDVIAQRIADLQPAVGVRIHTGCDFHLQFDNIQDALAHPDKYTINQTGYLLVEFPDLSVFTNAERILSRLIDAGIAPILTHPERNPHLQRRLDDIARWVELGCYVQVTAGSYTGLFGRRAKACADELIARGLTQFVASDAHDTKIRRPSLREAYDALAAAWGDDRIKPLFTENPGAVLTGDRVDVDISPAGRRTRKWYQFWR